MVAGRAAEGSGTGTKALSGYSPSRQTERRTGGQTVRGTKRHTVEINEGIGFRKIHRWPNSHCS